MPKVSLVVCLRNETAFLKRLLQHCTGCYDDLVIVHDGMPENQPPKALSISPPRDAERGHGLEEPGAPSPQICLDYSNLKKTAQGPKSYLDLSKSAREQNLAKLVDQHHGFLFAGPRCFQQEPHWPFAWWKARHDWILRLDADEYPSVEMRLWLRRFRKASTVARNISGFSCRWPFWDGRGEFCFSMEEWRPFLFHKHRVSFIGMAEQGPIPVFSWRRTGLTLHHRPARPSFGFSYIFFRKQSYSWRTCIAASLMRRPMELPRWRYNRKNWPTHWAQVIQRPWSVGLYRFLRILSVNLASAPKRGLKFCQYELFGAPLHQLCIAWTFGFFCLKSALGIPCRYASKARLRTFNCR